MYITNSGNTNFGDKMRYNTNITVRLSHEQRKFVEDSAKMLEVTPAKFIRMVLASLMANWSLQVNQINRSSDNED